MTTTEQGSGGQLRIGQLAALAATTTRAADLSREIEKLEEIRARALELAGSSRVAEPMEIWQTALRQHALRDETAAVPAREREAVELLDALHPHGIHGVIEQATELLSEPDRTAELGALLERFRNLTDDPAQIEDIATSIAAAVPRPASTSPAIDVEAMESLVGDRFTAEQRLCMRRVRALLEAGTEPTRR